MSNLEKLYYNMENLSDNWCDEPGVESASDRLSRAMGDELCAKYEDEILNLQCENHKDGFIKGFQYAMSLMGTKAVTA